MLDIISKISQLQDISVIPTQHISNKLLEKLRNVSLSMFRKDFFGIFHGSISARLSQDDFIINKAQAVFDNLTPQHLISLKIQKDYRWNEASIDTPIHAQIYQTYKNAKFIVYAMPPYSTSYTLTHKTLKPLDYFGYKFLGQEIQILDPNNYETWYDRAQTEIAQAFANLDQNFLLIRGYGIYIFDRDLHSLAKTVALVENTCKILHYSTKAEKV